jgi:dual 3',5'-cyclic-AMP and -GMP phosphodiesterase 11
MPLIVENFNLVHRKISAHEFERGGLLKPIVNTIDGTPTFLSISSQNDSSSSNSAHHHHHHHHHHQQNGTINSLISGRPQRLSRNELKHLDEKELIFELVSG